MIIIESSARGGALKMAPKNIVCHSCELYSSSQFDVDMAVIMPSRRHVSHYACHEIF